MDDAENRAEEVHDYAATPIAPSSMKVQIRVDGYISIYGYMCICICIYIYIYIYIYIEDIENTDSVFCLRSLVDVVWTCFKRFLCGCLHVLRFPAERFLSVSVNFVYTQFSFSDDIFLWRQT